MLAFAGCVSLAYLAATATAMAAATTSEPVPGAHGAVVASAARADSVVLELILPARVAHGAPVSIALRLRNAGEEPVVLGLTGRPVAFDLIVARQDGTEVWRRLHGAMVPMVLELRRLAPGEAVEFSDRWLQVDNGGSPVSPGRYTVRGFIPVEDRQLASEPHELVIGR